MTLGEWLRPPRRVLSLLIGVSALLAVLLSWLGWRLLQQDRALEAQRLRGQLEQAADRVARVLGAAVERMADSLELLAGGFPVEADAAVLVLTRENTEVWPTRRLPWRPVVRPPASAPAEEFAVAEALEYRAGDHVAAAAALRRLLPATPPPVRAGALLRLGRVLRRNGQLDSALAVYGALAREDSAYIEGLPADLLGRYAAIDLLDRSGRDAEARASAESAYADLLAGRWSLTAGSFAFYQQSLRSRLDPERGARLDAGAAAATALAVAADSLWALWLASDSGDRFEGHRQALTAGQPVFMLWRGSGVRAVALVAGPGHLGSWLERHAGPVRQGARVSLADREGRLLTPGGHGTGPAVLRTAVQTGLPWTLSLSLANPEAARAGLAARRALVLLGLAVAGLIVLLGLYAVTRAVSREIEVVRLKSDFVSAVSHEFRTPLTTIRQLTELLATGRVAAERRSVYYETLKSEAERLHRLVESLLDFGRMEAGALEFRFEPLEVSGLVTGIVGEFRREIEGRGYSVSLEIGEGNGLVNADREGLSRAIWNLLDNAIKYSPGQQPVAVSVARSNGAVAISVRDRGVGIPAEEQGRIFQKFVRGAGSQVRTVKGTGIGLSLVHHIVTAHGGEVRLDSAVGAGSTFTILLPAREVA